MISVYPWLYIDDSGNVWKVWVSDNKELYYNIMYSEGKWTKKNLIDVNVLDFAVHIDEEGLIHIVYSNKDGQLKYCTMRNKQWVGRTLYSIESTEFEIGQISIEILNEEMHVIYMIISNDNSDHAVLMHCKWNGNEAAVNALQDIILVPNVKKYYILQKNYDIFNLFFMTDEGDEAALKHCSFENKRWSDSRRLYGIQGDNIYFDVLCTEHEINVLNRSSEDSTYLLDHVLIDVSGNIKDFRVFESTFKPLEALLIYDRSTLYSCWLDKDGIFYSVFDGVKWSTAKRFEIVNSDTLYRYYSFMIYEEDKHFSFKNVYGTIEPDLNIFIPEDLIKEVNNSLYLQTSDVSEGSLSRRGEVQNFKIELQRIKVENKNLEKKISALNMQLQKKQRLLEDHEDTIIKLLEQKRKVEENCNIYLEVQRNNQKELERIKTQLSDANEKNLTVKDKVEEYEKENKELREFIETVTEENKALSVKLKEIQENSNEIKQEFKRIEEEKFILEKQVLIEKQENLRLQEELQFEKNQSIMDRLLRRKSNEV